MRNRMVLIVMIVMVFVLSACGGASPTEQPAPTDVPTNAPTESVPEVATEEAPVVEPTDESTEASTEESPASGVTIARVSFPQTSARSGPATSFEVVLRVSVNQEFPVIAQTGEGTNVWYLVDIGDGQTGWLWSNVVTIIPEGAVIEAAATVPAP